VKLRPVPEERCFADHQRVQKLWQLVGPAVGIHYHTVVLVWDFEGELIHSSSEPGFKKRPFLNAEADAAFFMNQIAEQSELAIGDPARAERTGMDSICRRRHHR